VIPARLHVAGLWGIKFRTGVLIWGNVWIGGDGAGEGAFSASCGYNGFYVSRVGLARF